MHTRRLSVVASSTTSLRTTPHSSIFLASRSCSVISPSFEVELGAITRGLEGYAVKRKVAEYVIKTTELDDIALDEKLVDKNYQELVSRFHQGKTLDEDQQFTLRAYVRAKMAEYQTIAIRNSPEEAEEFAASAKEMEDALLTPHEPTILPTCDAPFDTSEHPFITDLAGSIALARVSKRVAREKYFLQVQKKTFAKQAKKNADDIFKMAQGNYRITRKILSETAVERNEKKTNSYDELFAKAVRTIFGEDLNDKQVLDKVFHVEPVETTVFPEKELGKPWNSPDVIAHRINRMTRGKVTPEHEEFKEYSAVLMDAGDPETTEQKESMRKMEECQERFKKLRPKLELLLKDKSAVMREMSQVSLRNGEHGVFFSALKTFLANNQNPSRANKLFFMQQQRDYFLRARQSIDLRARFPHIRITPANLSDDELVAKFDELAKFVTVD